MQGLIDTTLREGAQSVGVHFRLDEKIRIVSLLMATGIEEIELGLAANPAGMRELLHGCRRLGGGSRLALWCRCREDDIRAAARLRPDVLSLSIPASDLHLEHRLRRNRQWAIDNLRAAIRQAQAAKLPYISVGLEDAGRADPDFLDLLTEAATKAGANRIRLADTVGTCSPEQITAMVGRVRKATPIAIGIHAHNDFGMATANTISALHAGADWGDVSVLGLGERAGMAKLEEVAGYLALQHRRPGYRADLLKTLCETVARATKRPIAPHHPVIGEAIFSCETGLHLQGLLREPSTYEPFDPRRVGSERRLLFGTKVGQGAVQILLDQRQATTSPDTLRKITNAIRKQANKTQQPLPAHEIITPAPP